MCSKLSNRANSYEVGLIYQKTQLSRTYVQTIHIDIVFKILKYQRFNTRQVHCTRSGYFLVCCEFQCTEPSVVLFPETQNHVCDNRERIANNVCFLRVMFVSTQLQLCRLVIFITNNRKQVPELPRMQVERRVLMTLFFISIS